MIFWIGLAVGASVTAFSMFLFLLWCVSKAYELGVRDVKRKQSEEARQWNKLVVEAIEQ